MPSDHRFGRDDQECLFPTGPASWNKQPEELVQQIQLWAWMTPFEHDKLLAKCQILEKKTVMRAKEPNKRSEAKSQETKHNGDL